MSSESPAPRGQTGAPEPRIVTFGDAIEHDVDVRDREQVLGNVRWAVVEYGPGAGREGWCTQPHMGFLISGELEYEFEDGRPALRITAGNGFALPSWPAHAGRNHGTEPARLFIIDALVSDQG